MRRKTGLIERGLIQRGLVGLMLVLALSGCGRQGALEAPPGAAVVKATPVDPNKADGDQGEAARQSAPKKSFFLDFLL